jgi:hypothetical protein
MKTRTLKELLLYNYRYWFGYSIICGFIVYFLGWQLGSLTGGLSQAEISTAARHTALADIAKLPLYPLHSLLQFISFETIGVTAFTIRLGGAAIGLLVAFTLYSLLKKWFGKPTALLSTAIFISADWFLFIARLGTGGIELSLWLTLALLCFTKLIERKPRWLILYACAISGLLFAPFGIYAAVTLTVSLFAGRIFRERTQEASLRIKILSIAILLTSVCAVAYFSFQNIEFLKNLLGIQALPSVVEYGKNALGNMSSVVAVLPHSNPLISPTGVFFVRFFELIFILFGVIMFWRTRVNRLNLTVLLLSFVLVLASGLSAGSRGDGLVLVPAAIFMTAGIRHFIHRWQRTFPKNPYARVGAYVPISLLFIAVVAAHYMSYFKLWPHQSSTRTTFSKDFILATHELNSPTLAHKVCFIESTDSSFNKLLAASNPRCEPHFPESQVSKKLPDILLLRPDSTLLRKEQTVRAVTSDTTSNNVRWLLVKNQP